MPDLFLKQVTIENLKCFQKQVVKLTCPDGNNEGSGLNIIIGENGNGKTTILDAISFLTQSSYSSENKIGIGDFFNKDEEIRITSETAEEFRCSMPWRGNYFTSTGFEFSAKCRERKAPGKLLSSPFSVNTSFITKETNYRNSKGQDSGRAILPLYSSFSKENIEDGEINVFLFDKNRNRQINAGTFRTTFDRICEDLNWKFAKNISDKTIEGLLKNIVGEYFQAVMDTAQKGAGEKLGSGLSIFFNNSDYQQLKIDLLDLMHPFGNAFFAVRKPNELKQIRAKDLGSGIEMILTVLLLRSIAGESKGSIVYLIDEPELHLHPRAQDKLVALLLQESKTKQVILSTHSPYIFKNCLGRNASFIIAKRNAKNEIVLDYAGTTGWGKLPWSPSWGEINFHAFDMPTFEFHNELYGYIQETTQSFTVAQMEGYLVKRGVPQDRSWIKMEKGKALTPASVTLQTYIRNLIHHPENTSNTTYTTEELKKSIEDMIKLFPLP